MADHRRHSTILTSSRTWWRANSEMTWRRSSPVAGKSTVGKERQLHGRVSSFFPKTWGDLHSELKRFPFRLALDLEKSEPLPLVGTTRCRHPVLENPARSEDGRKAPPG